MTWDPSLDWGYIDLQVSVTVTIRAATDTSTSVEVWTARRSTGKENRAQQSGVFAADNTAATWHLYQPTSSSLELHAGDRFSDPDGVIWQITEVDQRTKVSTYVCRCYKSK